MSALNASTALMYANVQMAAEAIYPIGFTQGQIPVTTLTEGNNRSSKFPLVLAQQFAQEWSVLAHQPNTNTGFSGTLFKYTGNNDPVRGLVKDQVVISLRSTEFADDAARDNQATNKLEIAEFGWAFGQIADMKNWIDGLTQSGKVAGTVDVTGYSLGGHLATAFNLLHRLEVLQLRAVTLNDRLAEQSSGELFQYLAAQHDSPGLGAISMSSPSKGWKDLWDGADYEQTEASPSLFCIADTLKGATGVASFQSAHTC